MSALWDDQTRQVFENGTRRPYTAAEVRARLLSYIAPPVAPPPAKVQLEAMATSALDANRTFLALETVSAAATLAQVKALSRQNNVIIRLLTNNLDGTD